MKESKYIILDDPSSKLLSFILTNQFRKEADFFIPLLQEIETEYTAEQLNEKISEFQKFNILSLITFETPDNFIYSLNIKTPGLSSDDLLFPYRSFSLRTPLSLILEAFHTLVRVRWITKFQGMEGLTNVIQKMSTTGDSLIFPDINSFKPLASAINKASNYVPLRIECLEWSSTLVLMALKRGWKCNLIIGVQSHPFYAHAWVESNNNIIVDSKDLSSNMAIILSTPFNIEEKI